MAIRERIAQVNDAEKSENLVLHRVSLQKVRVMKNILKSIVRRRELEMVRQPLADWFEFVFVVPFEDRFNIPAVDRTLHDCQQLLYLHNQHKAILKSKLHSFNNEQNYSRNDQLEISNLKNDKNRLEILLQNHSEELRNTNAEIENLHRNLQRVKTESQRLIQGGVQAVQTEEEYMEQRPTASNLRRFR